MGVITKRRSFGFVEVQGWDTAQGNSCEVQLYFHQPEPSFHPCGLPVAYSRLIEVNDLVFKQWVCEKHALEDGE